MYINPYAEIIAYMDDIAICEDDFGGLWYAEMPESCAELGSVLEISSLTELDNLPENRRKEVLGYIAPILVKK